MVLRSVTVSKYPNPRVNVGTRGGSTVADAGGRNVFEVVHDYAGFIRSGFIGD